MSVPQRVRDLVEPLVADLGLGLYDLEYSSGILRVVVTQDGGVGMDAITALTKAISRSIDENDPISSHFTLEVSSPGLERTLRTPAHFADAVGSKISVKLSTRHDGARRLAGVLDAAGPDGISLLLDQPPGESCEVAYDQIERARTVFDWGPAPKPGKAPRPRDAAARRPAGNAPKAPTTTSSATGGASAPVDPTPDTEEKVPAS